MVKKEPVGASSSPASRQPPGWPELRSCRVAGSHSNSCVGLEGSQGQCVTVAISSPSGLPPASTHHVSPGTAGTRDFVSARGGGGRGGTRLRLRRHNACVRATRMKHARAAPHPGGMAAHLPAPTGQHAAGRAQQARQAGGAGWAGLASLVGWADLAGRVAGEVGTYGSGGAGAAGMAPARCWLVLALPTAAHQAKTWNRWPSVNCALPLQFPRNAAPLQPWPSTGLSSPRFRQCVVATFATCPVSARY